MLSKNNINNIIELVEQCKVRSFIPKSASMCRVLMDEGRYRVLSDGTRVTFHQLKFYNRLGPDKPLAMICNKNFKQTFHAVLAVDDYIFDPFNEVYGVSIEKYVKMYDEKLLLGFDLINDATNKWVEERKEHLLSLGLLETDKCP